MLFRSDCGDGCAVRCIWSGASIAAITDVDVKGSDLLGDAIHSHWYHRAKADALLDLLGDARHRVVADIGAGS